MSTRAPEVAEGLARGRIGFKSWLEEMLGEFLPADDADSAAERRRALFGLHAALDVFTWKLFRRDLGLSPEQTEVQLTNLVLGLLARHPS